MCQSGIYCVNTTTDASIAAGGVYAPNTVIHKYGCACAMGSNGVVLKQSGYYDVQLNVSVTASAAGTILATIYKNGVAVPGALASATVTAAAQQVSFCIPYLEYIKCNCDDVVLTCVITGEAVTSVNLAWDVSKVG